MISSTEHPETDPITSPDAADPVPSSIRELLALFRDELSGQRFGDLDAAALEELAERTRAAAEDVDRARAALDAAHARLHEAREELARRAQQGLAYAQVYAAEDPVLRDKLAALGGQAAPRPERRRGPKRASATRKEEAEAVAELPFDARGAA